MRIVFIGLVVLGDFAAMKNVSGIMKRTREDEGQLTTAVGMCRNARTGCKTQKPRPGPSIGGRDQDLFHLWRDTLPVQFRDVAADIIAQRLR